MTQSPLPATDLAAILQQFVLREAVAARLIPENRARLIAHLASAAITRVVVTFDGGGDSGQIEDISGSNGDPSDPGPSDAEPFGGS